MKTAIVCVCLLIGCAGQPMRPTDQPIDQPTDQPPARPIELVLPPVSMIA